MRPNRGFLPRALPPATLPLSGIETSALFGIRDSFGLRATLLPHPGTFTQNVVQYFHAILRICDASQKAFLIIGLKTCKASSNSTTSSFCFYIYFFTPSHEASNPDYSSRRTPGLSVTLQPGLIVTTQPGQATTKTLEYQHQSNSPPYTK